MAILSSTVSAGDTILASQYNNLRTDLLTGDIAVAGVKTFSGIPVFSAGITINDNSTVAATKKLFFGSDADTYIHEISLNNLQFVAAADIGLTLDGESSPKTADFGWSVTIPSGLFLYFDGGGDTNIRENIANTLQFVVGGNLGLTIDSSQAIYVEATKLLMLDGGDDTYLTESSNDVMDFYTGGVRGFRIDSSSNAVITAAKAFYFDDGVHTFIAETSDNILSFSVGGNTNTLINASGLVCDTLVVNAATKLFIDSGGDTYLIESAANIMKLFAGGNEGISVIADGGVIMVNLKSGNTQGAAGAAANELWVDSDDDNTIKLGT